MRVLDLRLKPSNGKPLKAFADVELDNGMIIREFRIIQEPGKHPVVATPQTSWKDPRDDRIKYTAIVTLPQPLKVKVDLLILAAWLREKESESGIPER